MVPEDYDLFAAETEQARILQASQVSQMPHPSMGGRRRSSFNPTTWFTFAQTQSSGANKKAKVSHALQTLVSDLSGLPNSTLTHNMVKRMHARWSELTDEDVEKGTMSAEVTEMIEDLKVSADPSLAATLDGVSKALAGENVEELGLAPGSREDSDDAHGDRSESQGMAIPSSKDGRNTADEGREDFYSQSFNALSKSPLFN